MSETITIEWLERRGVGFVSPREVEAGAAILAATVVGWAPASSGPDTGIAVVRVRIDWGSRKPQTERVVLVHVRPAPNPASALFVNFHQLLPLLRGLLVVHHARKAERDAA